jgi:hypothetical protein
VENLGDKENEGKVQEVKKAMKDKDPAVYFETFVK